MPHPMPVNKTSIMRDKIKIKYLKNMNKYNRNNRLLLLDIVK
jgi:hypothetical protein